MNISKNFSLGQSKLHVSYFANLQILLREVGKSCVKVNTFYGVQNSRITDPPPPPNESQTLANRRPKGVIPPVKKKALYNNFVTKKDNKNKEYNFFLRGNLPERHTCTCQLSILKNCQASEIYVNFSE